MVKEKMFENEEIESLKFHKHEKATKKMLPQTSESRKFTQMFDKLRNLNVFFDCFEKFTGHNKDCLTSFESFVKFMHQPTDAASLGMGRMLFGKFFCFWHFLWLFLTFSNNLKFNLIQ